MCADDREINQGAPCCSRDYPRYDTPGCTMEAIDFSDRDDEFSRLKTVVLGVSMDDCTSHGMFRDKHGLSV